MTARPVEKARFTAWWCSTCDVIVRGANRPDSEQHAHSWGRDGVRCCPGSFKRGTFEKR